MSGVGDHGTEGVLIRSAATTRPLMKWKVGCELRRRVKAALDAEGIQIASAQRRSWIGRRGPRCAGRRRRRSARRMLRLTG